MLDIIIKSLLNVTGFIVLFYVSHAIKESIVFHLTEEDPLTGTFTDDHHIEFHERRRTLIINGFIACLLFSLLTTVILSYAIYNADLTYLAMNLQSLGIFIVMFTYSYWLVLFSALEGKRKHFRVCFERLKIDLMEFSLRADKLFNNYSKSEH